MLDPVICYTCGLLLDDRSMLFKALKLELVKKTLDDLETNPINAAIDPEIRISFKEILDKLHYDMPCCRKTIITNMDFSAMY